MYYINKLLYYYILMKKTSPEANLTLDLALFIKKTAVILWNLEFFYTIGTTYIYVVDTVHNDLLSSFFV